jgi:hypothetical protein
MDDEFPDLPLDNFGPATNVAASPAEEVKAAPEVAASGSEVAQEAQPVKTEDNPSADNKPSEQATEQSGTDVNQANPERPEKRDRVQTRFDEITRKSYEQQAYIEQLERQAAQFEASKGITLLKPDENGSIDPEALQKYIADTAKAQATTEVSMLNNRLEREQIASRINKEGSQIEKRYKETLDSDPIHAENIKELVEARINDNLYSTERLKAVSPIKIAELYFKGIEAAAKRASTQTQQNLDALKAESAVTLTGSPNPVGADSDEALEARVAEIKF